MKRYIRLDLEYEGEGYDKRHIALLHRLIRRDMPYVKVIQTRDTPDKAAINLSWDDFTNKDKRIKPDESN